MFENNGNVHVYSPGAGADSPGAFFFKNDFCRKIGQGQPRVAIYLNFVELDSPMYHAKIQDHRPCCSGEDS